jgi:hypothetical protein
MTLDLGRVKLSGTASRKAAPAAAGFAAGAGTTQAAPASAAASATGGVSPAESGPQPAPGPEQVPGPRAGEQNGHRVRIMKEYLETMERFLVMQQGVMAAFQARRRKAAPENSAAPGDPE